VIDLIRGKSVPEAINILHFSPKHAARVAEKVLRSAVSNYQNKDEGRVDPESLFVKKAFVDGGPGMKRVLPAPMGRAYRIVKRSNHVTIVVDAKDGAAARAATGRPKAAAEAARPKGGAKAAEKETAPAKKSKAAPADEPKD
jgi:large subunit ribosomal protein L22